MTVAFIVCDQRGKILRTGSCQDELVSAQTVDDTEISFAGTVSKQEEYYVSLPDKVVKALPAKPSPHHEWDWTTKSWLPNLDAAKAAKKAEIEAERNRRINAPLIYGGKVLDADQAARDNLKAKLEEVRERIRINMPMAPELLVWRDNGDQTHSWPTIEAYHDWLAGYAVAMSDRGTRCYACAWHHKDVLKVVNDPNGQPWTVESIAAHDITAGWP